MTITKDYLPISMRRSGLKMDKVVFIVCHDVGNPNSSAKGNVKYYHDTKNDSPTGVHSFIDDKEVIEIIPLDEKCNHVRRSVGNDKQLYGVYANDAAIGVELCYFPQEPERSKTAYNNYTAYIATLCRNYALDPLQKLVGHYVCDPVRRTDPLNAFRYLNKSMEQFLQDVKNEMKLDIVLGGDPITPSCWAQEEKIKSLKVWITNLLTFISRWYNK